jgi:hypothetical protein
MCCALVQETVICPLICEGQKVGKVKGYCCQRGCNWFKYFITSEELQPQPDHNRLLLVPNFQSFLVGFGLVAVFFQLVQKDLEN